MSATYGRDNSRANEVIRRLRSYVMKAPFERKDFDLNDLVAETVNFLAPQARSRQVVLRSRLTPRSPADQWRSDPVAAGVVEFDPECGRCGIRHNAGRTSRDGGDARWEARRGLGFGHRARAYPRRSQRRYSTHFFPRRSTAWAWVFLSCARLWPRTAARSISRTGTARPAQFFESSCRWSKGPTVGPAPTD